jgi:hypothetical protein
MQYEVRQKDGWYYIYRVGPTGDRDMWDSFHDSWDTRERWAAPYSSEASVREAVRRNKFFPCVIVKEEILPEPEEKESEIPTLSFEDLAVGERYIYFLGNDPTTHHVFQKLNVTDAQNCFTGGTIRNINHYKTGKVIRVRFS